MIIRKLKLIFCLALFTNLAYSQAEFKMEETASSADPLKSEYNKAVEQLVAAARSYEKLNTQSAFTLFAPNNRAFKKVPLETIQFFLKPENEEALSNFVNYHTLDGKYTLKQLRKMIDKNGGEAHVSTLGGVKLTLTSDDSDKILITNSNGVKVRITEGNWEKEKGIVHVVDQVILPYRFLQ